CDLADARPVAHRARDPHVAAAVTLRRAATKPRAVADPAGDRPHEAAPLDVGGALEPERRHHRSPGRDGLVAVRHAFVGVAALVFGGELARLLARLAGVVAGVLVVPVSDLLRLPN